MRKNAAKKGSGDANAPIKPKTFDALLKEGLDFHDRAEKRRNDNPEAACALFRQAIDRYQAAEQMLCDNDNNVDLQYNMGHSYGALGSVLKDLDTRNSSAQADEALVLACERYGMVVTMESSHAEALNNWGATLTSLAESRGGEEGCSLLGEAVMKLESALEIAPGDLDTVNNLADALSAWAQLIAPVEWSRAETLWRSAYAKYEQALSLTEYPSDRVDCLSNWSNALTNHATLAQQAGDNMGAAVLFEAAAEKLQVLLQIQPHDSDGYVACAEALKSVGECRSSTEIVYQYVGTAFSAALNINANHVEALAGLGELCLDYGRELLVQGRQEEGIARLAEAWNWFSRLLAITPTDATSLYNAACACALAGNVDVALDCLTKSRFSEEAAGTDPIAWVQTTAQDQDFLSLHQHPIFASIVTVQPP